MRAHITPVLLAISVIMLGAVGAYAADDEHPEIPFEAVWAASGHADAAAEAFIHWDEDDPPLVSKSCAKCHSGAGFLDFLGADGTEAGTIDNAPDPGVITCVACHNEAAMAMDSVVMPSGVELTGLGAEARCMQCHQGRQSTVSVNDYITAAGATDEDAVAENLSFRNPHYYVAAATQFGTLAQGGYQYAEKTYDAKFAHVEGIDTCVTCHDPHSLEVRVEECSVCHTDVVEVDDLKAARLEGSLADYDGDGDFSEGIYHQIEHLKEILYQAIQAYASDAGTPIVYDALSNPYWFTDTGERYNGFWTPRLLKASYNYHFSMKDPGGFAHGGKYVIQLLYDSIEDLDTGLAAGLQRDDPGHFAGSTEAWRHWDEDGEVQGSCAKCHSATGLPFYLEVGANRAEPLSNGMLCSTCHDSLPEFTRYAVDEVEFPSGAEVGFGEAADANLCLNCHQGRQSTVSVNSSIGDNDDNTVVKGLRFANVHYFVAGATLFGTEAQGAYEYDGQSYNGRFAHVGTYSTCTQCHDAHALDVKVQDCAMCHPGTATEEDLEAIRMGGADFDGDGDTAEGIAGEVETLGEFLYAALESYATDVVGTGIVYDSHSYPYWFTDTGESYGTWTPSLLRGAYNYQYLMKDPGAYAHNPKYIIQILYDSLAGLGADVSGMVRP